MRIATWNVNSITARLPRLLAWLESSGTDVLCIQETKCAEDAFPFDELRELGYEAAVNATGRWNGVAIVSRVGLEDVVSGLPGGPDPDSRRCMPWDERAWNVGLCDHYRALIRLRRSSPALCDGGFQLLYAHGDTLAFAREAPDERLIVVAAPSLLGKGPLPLADLAGYPLIQQATRPRLWIDWFAAADLGVGEYHVAVRHFNSTERGAYRIMVSAL